MNREEYEAARAALLGNPPRHPKIAGEQPTSIEELDALAARMGLASKGELATAAEPPASPHAPDQTSVAPSATSSEDIRQLGERIIAHIDLRFDDLRALLAAAVQAAPVVEVQEQTGSTETPLAPDIVPPIKPAVTRGDAPEIPENLGTLSFNQLKALAKDLGMDPVPRTQAALLDAIEAKRKGAG